MEESNTRILPRLLAKALSEAEVERIAGGGDYHTDTMCRYSAPYVVAPTADDCDVPLVG